MMARKALRNKQIGSAVMWAVRGKVRIMQGVKGQSAKKEDCTHKYSRYLGFEGLGF